MEWFDKKFVAACQKHDIEPIGTNKKITFVCSKLPGKVVQRNLAKNLPEDWTFEFVESMKSLTVATVKMVAANIGASSFTAEQNREKHGLTIDMSIAGELHPQAVEELRKTLTQDKWIQLFDIKVNGELVDSFNRTYEKVLSERKLPDHDTITKEDLLDLKITLGTCNTIEDFINSM